MSSREELSKSPVPSDKKIFFTDLDGTLLTDSKQITSETRDTVHRALDAGHLIVLTTGRTLASTKRQAEKLGLDRDGCYLICYNGALLYDIGAGKILHTCSIPFDIVFRAFKIAHEQGVHIQTYDADDCVITDHDSPLIKAYCEIQSLSWKVVDNIETGLKCEPPKILAIENDPEKMNNFRIVMEKAFSDVMSVFLSQPNYMEMVTPETSKGNAVRMLCSLLDIPIEHSISAGDAENDLTLIQAAHIGAVMRNGSESVKEYADYITENDNNHDGAAEIIKKFLLNE